MKDLLDKIVVITGASSGIGRATALQFAGRGAKLVLAARHSDSLRDVEQECIALGSEAITVTTDVTKEEQVEHLAKRTEEVFGRIDVWVNNAAVAMFAKFEEAPTEDWRRVIETDFFGYVYGARVALRRFKKQGNGTLINVDSLEGVAPTPYNSAYAAAKHGVRALASSLRMELLLENQSNIYVCTVTPASVDTPLFAHAANYTGQTIQGPSTALTPGRVAEVITNLAIKPQREVVIGTRPAAHWLGYGVAPAVYERKIAQVHSKRYLSDDTAPGSSGNLYEPSDPHQVESGWRTAEEPSRLRSLAPWIAGAVAIITIGGIAALLIRRAVKTEIESEELL